jgi:hypothetical protein
VALFLALCGCSSPTEPPKAFDAFVVKDAAFACDAPKGWELKTGSRPDNTYSWVKFTKGSTEVRIDADVTGSLLADISKSFGGDDPDNPPVAALHEMKIDQLAEDLGNYKEQPAEPFQSTHLGEGRKGEFTADGNMGSKQRGYHATLLSNNRRLTIICRCPSGEWKKLAPSFDRIIASVKGR